MHADHTEEINHMCKVKLLVHVCTDKLCNRKLQSSIEFRLSDPAVGGQLKFDGSLDVRDSSMIAEAGSSQATYETLVNYKAGPNISRHPSQLPVLRASQ